jgi:hypothetical protein
VRGESGVSIHNDLFWEPKPGVNILQIKRGNAQAHDRGGAGQEDGCPGAPVVDYREDGVFAPYPWEARNQVH